MVAPPVLNKPVVSESRPGQSIIKGVQASGDTANFKWIAKNIMDQLEINNEMCEKSTAEVGLKISI